MVRVIVRCTPKKFMLRNRQHDPATRTYCLVKFSKYCLVVFYVFNNVKCPNNIEFPPIGQSLGINLKKLYSRQSLGGSVQSAFEYLAAHQAHMRKLPPDFSQNKACAATDFKEAFRRGKVFRDCPHQQRVARFKPEVPVF